MASILIVDDLLSIHEMLDAVIQPTGFATAFATDGEMALARYRSEPFDVVLADIDMKPVDGITLLKQLKVHDPHCAVIIMTAYASTESAILALKYGAFDYLQKPFRVDELIATLKRALEFRRQSLERSSQSAAPVARNQNFEQRLIGHSPKAVRLLQQVRKLAAVRTPVLLQGEPGTGRTTVAELLHEASVGAEAPLIRIDCCLSSEADFRAGLLGENGLGGNWVSAARGGTLLLKDLHALPLPLQKELVAVLRNTAHGFRLMCTTTVDLEKRVDESTFHDELFYRVASLPISLPAVRDRREDIPELVRHFTQSATNPQFEPAAIAFAQDALDVLQAYAWPGNLTELQQVVTGLATTTDSRLITAAQLPARLRETPLWVPLADYLATQERQYIERVLHAHGGDREATARALNIDAARVR